MLVIRLARAGRKKYPTYRVVAAEKSNAATGKFVEMLGHYNPHTKEVVLDKDGIAKRVSQGAQPSNTVLKLMVREGMELPKWAKVAQKSSPSKNPVEEAAAPEEAALPTESEAEAEVAADEAAAPAEEAAAPAVEETPAGETADTVEAAADPDEKAAASNEAQEAAADAAEAVTLKKKEDKKDEAEAK